MTPPPTTTTWRIKDWNLVYVALRRELNGAWNHADRACKAISSSSSSSLLTSSSSSIPHTPSHHHHHRIQADQTCKEELARQHDLLLKLHFADPGVTLRCINYAAFDNVNITFDCNIVFPFESAILGAACPVQREIGDREEPGASNSHKQDSELDSHKRDMANLDSKLSPNSQ